MIKKKQERKRNGETGIERERSNSSCLGSFVSRLLPFPLFDINPVSRPRNTRTIKKILTAQDNFNRQTDKQTEQERQTDTQRQRYKQAGRQTDRTKQGRPKGREEREREGGR